MGNGKYESKTTKTSKNDKVLSRKYPKRVGAFRTIRGKRRNKGKTKRDRDRTLTT